MNLKRFGVPAVVAVTAALALSSCAANEGGGSATPEETGSSLSGTIDAAGASSQGSAQEAWVAAFQTANPDVTINYDPSGSGAGREAFIAGGVDFAGSDSFLKDEELAGEFAACAPDTKAIDLPVYISPIAVVFNVDGVDELNLDSATLAKIFKGDITKWNDPAIAALNEGAKLPDANITAVHRSDDSGTTKNFADYLNQTAGDVWAEEPSDTFPYQTGEGAQGTSGVVDAVTNGVNTIGYADASKAGDLGVAKIKVGDEFVGYTPEAAAAVVAESPLVEGREANDLAIALDRTTTDPSHYPLVLVSYAIVCQEYADAAQGELVKSYVGYMASEEGQSVAAEQAGSAPLSTELSDQVSAALESVK
ncbi:phosphate ABC transporter substrate-binding protein PstS [Agromyces endophyticus]|uniref:phosphate ABC transporter substrate-binding protein PstS n=1 Tax=Agromyces sp. H17E-10 TaxID=2932244 RepID=UPI001FD41550|nr:phosphate ABC transporter substrate-binding protein PstS [Agromyces sp. H17E-10]UOQ88399.1 phosphate ABC transporter substrate-binding protein PstS [Agromyces sp. H17E-10]